MPSIYLLAFWIFLIGAWTVSWHAGDRQDRRCIIAIVAAAALSAVFYSYLAPFAALVAVALVDLTLLLIIGRYALVSDRYWPLWFAGFHAVGLFFTLCALAMPSEWQMIPWRLSGFWSLPSLIAMTAGLLIDRRAGVVNRARA